MLPDYNKYKLSFFQRRQKATYYTCYDYFVSTRYGDSRFFRDANQAMEYANALKQALKNEYFSIKEVKGEKTKVLPNNSYIVYGWDSNGYFIGKWRIIEKFSVYD